MPTATSKDLLLGLGVPNNELRISSITELRTQKFINICSKIEGDKEPTKVKAEVFLKPYPFENDWYILLKTFETVIDYSLSEYCVISSQKNDQTKWFEKIQQGENNAQNY